MSNPWKLNDAGLALLQKADTVAREVIAPAAKELDEKAMFPKGTLGAMRDAGLLRLVSAKEVGGHGQGLRAAVATCERFARECASTAMITKMHFCGSAVIEAHGNMELRKAISEKGKVTTLAFSEYGSRSHFWVPVSTAKKAGDKIKLTAAKQLITSAGNCDIYVWSSKPAAAEGLSSIWAVPVDAPGLKIPQSYAGLGLRGNASAPINANDVEIPAGWALGGDGKGFDIMMGIVMPWFSLQNCAVSVGMMEGALERTVRHVTKGKYAYNQTVIADLPQVRGWLARARLKIDLVRGHLLDSLDAIENSRPDAVMRVLQSKVAGAETSLEVHDLCMRVSGGAGYRKDNDLERFFRDSRAASVMAPVSDALYEFIGKAVCGMPVFG
ncbi:MAG: acyl-CoA/acyl-ACP dehydrogenase [Planctomycetes bacterium]|nr:acyl-CoA/acyl-ACP dehydrogenase [Planctomycetota bacterium]